MGPIRSRAWLLAAALLCGTPGAATADDFDEARQAAVGVAVKALEKLGTWCQEKKLYATRREIAETLLEYRPGNTRAHKWLKHKFKGGEWVVPDKPAKATDWDKKALAEFPAKRDELLAPAAAAFEEVYRKFEDSLQSVQKARLLRDLTYMAPDNAVYRELSGDVRVDGKWVLHETAASLKRREAIRQLAVRALKSVPSTKRGPSASRGWKWTAETEDYAVLGLASRAEVEACIKHIHATGDFFRALFQVETPPRDDFTIMLFENKADALRYLGVARGVTQADLEEAKRLSGMWIPDRNWVVEYASRREKRLDAAVRQTVGTLIRDEFKIPGRIGWAREGFGVRLTWEITGTRLTSFVRSTKYAADRTNWGSRMDKSDDWLAEAAAMAKSGEAPDLRTLLYLDLNAMETQDLLYANALASYMLEGRPGQTVRLLRNVGRKMSPEHAFVDATGLDIATLQYRLRRWLLERR